MITSFFNKSKPVNFVIVFFITMLAFIAARANMPGVEVTVGFVFKQILLLFLAYASILLLNFIAEKNSLTQKNNYEILLFGLFLLTIVETTISYKVLLANFFVLLALRRILSISSQKAVKSKYFDAAFWIAIASLFYFWSVLFFVLIVASLILHADNSIRHWIVPFLGMATVFVITVALSILLYDDFFGLFNVAYRVNYDYSLYDTPTFLIGITMLVSFGLWSLLFYIQDISRAKKANRAALKLMVLAVFLSAFIVILAPNKNGSEFLFLFAPLAIVVSSYIEKLQDKWFKEVFVVSLLVVPFVLLML